MSNAEIEQEAFRFIVLAELKVQRDLIVSLCQGTNPLPHETTEEVTVSLQAKFESALEELLGGGADKDPARAAHIAAYLAKWKNRQL